MKTRNGYVSNSSSSSFLVPQALSSHVNAIKLPEEIWRAIWKNHVEWDGKTFDMSASDQWWLTTMIPECDNAYEQIANIPHAIPYLEGNSMPYGCYEDDSEKNYLKFHKDGEEFYVLISDFLNNDGKYDIPPAVTLRDNAKKIFNCKSMNKSQKLDALEHLFDF